MLWESSLSLYLWPWLFSVIIYIYYLLKISNLDSNYRIVIWFGRACLDLCLCWNENTLMITCSCFAFERRQWINVWSSLQLELNRSRNRYWFAQKCNITSCINFGDTFSVNEVWDYCGYSWGVTPCSNRPLF